MRTCPKTKGDCAYTKCSAQTCQRKDPVPFKWKAMGEPGPHKRRKSNAK